MTARYFYTARTEAGRFVQGSLSAPSQGAALGHLRARLLFVTSLQPADSAAGAVAALFQREAAPRKELVALYRCLATLIAAGVPLRRALNVTIEQSRSARLKEALESVRADIESGLDMSSALERRPLEFTALFVAMIRAGEAGGVLDSVLERIAALAERDYDVIARVRSTLAYPAILAVCSVTLLIFLLTGVLPTFRSLYQQMRVPIPAATQALIAAGEFLRADALYLAAGTFVCICAGAIGYARSSSTIQPALHDIALRLPLVGRILRNAEISRLARLLGTLLSAGIPFGSALPLVRTALTLPRYRRAVAEIVRALDAGLPVSEVIQKTQAFDGIFVQMCRAGEETGDLDEMLTRLSAYYDVEVEADLRALSAMIEPAMILLVGAAVGCIVAAIFVPLYSIVGSIR